MTETGGDSRLIHLVPAFTTVGGRLPGTGFQNRYQRKYSPLKRLVSPEAPILPEILHASPVRRIDPLSTTPLPTQQHRLLTLELHLKNPDVDTLQSMRPADQAQSRFRGRILDVQQDKFRAILESSAPEGTQYEVEIPIRDLPPHQHEYVESGAEFALRLSVRHGPEFDQQIRREFTFDDANADLPAFDAATLERAREAAVQQRRKWEQSSEEDFGDFHSPAGG